MTKQENKILAERQETHGDFRLTAYLAQNLKAKLHIRNSWNKLESIQQESLDMICTKIARILSGNPNDPDHWEDIKGYAELALSHFKNEGK